LEVGGAQEAHQFQVIPYTRPELDEIYPELLKGGDVITLHHVEIEANLCFSGARSATGRRPSPYAESIVPGGLKASSNGLWRVESPLVTWAGGLVQPGGAHIYMLKHIATGLYLACDSTGSLAMTADCTSSFVHWSIHAFKESSFGLGCAGTGSYLEWKGDKHKGATFFLIEGGRIPEPEEAEAEEGEPHRHGGGLPEFHLSTQPDCRSTTDVISITRVHPSEAESLMLVRRCVNVMRMYTNALREVVGSAKEEASPGGDQLTIGEESRRM